MSVEDRLRQAMGSEASGVDPDIEAGWDRVHARSTALRRQRRARAAALGALGTAAAVTLVAVIVTSGGDADQRVDAGKADETTATTDAPTTTDTTSTPTSDTTVTSLGEGAPVPVPGPSTSTTTAPAPREEPANAIWPFTTRAEVDAYRRDPGVGMFFDPQATALEFARAYLGMPDPVGIGRRDAGGGVVEIDVVPSPGYPQVTTVMVFLGATDDPWWVIGANARNIELHSRYPEPVTSPVRVRGRSRAYEAHVGVEVRQAGQGPGERLGEGYVMGGAYELEPFDGEVAFSRPSRATGAVVLFTASAEDGTVSEATVIRVVFAR